MFGCFSKKKKEKTSPLEQRKLNFENLTQPTPPEEILNSEPLPPPSKNVKKSKFCPIQPAQLEQRPEGEFNSTSLNMIDHMLEEELQSQSLPYVQEQTGYFGDLVPNTQTRQETSRFGYINAVNIDPISEDVHSIKIQDTKSISMVTEDLVEIESDEHCVPKTTTEEIHTINELTEQSTKKVRRTRRSTREGTGSSSHSRRISSIPNPKEFDSYDTNLEQWALDTTISLQNFKISNQRIHRKAESEPDDSLLMSQTLQEALNSFYCNGGDLCQELTRATISNDAPELPKRIFQRMTAEQKNSPNFKGYMPVQLLVLKSISNSSFVEFTKNVIYDPEVSLECRGPTGWTPLQQALFYRNIPLITHLFKACYSKKQQQFQQTLRKFSQFLQGMPDFEMEIEVKIDSFLPLVGNLTPSDTLKIQKRRGRLQLNYSLVGYEFPSCKRRDMEILFDGTTLWGINNSKKIYCDLLQQLEHEEMILMIEDMLTGEITRGWPIVHSINILKSLSLFQNEIVQEIAGGEAVKHSLQLCYTSTSEKRRSQVKSSNGQFNFLSSYPVFQEKRQSISIKEKNRNKKIELQLWLAKDFGLQMNQLITILEILSMGNSLISEWSKFFKNQVGALIEKSGYFPVKIDIPLNYSLYFNIQFKNFKKVSGESDLHIPKDVSQIKRKDFQGTLLSKQKRAVFIQVYT